jgi:hypothetical protein
MNSLVSVIKYLWRQKKEEIFSNSFNEASITLIMKSDKSNWNTFLLINWSNCWLTDIYPINNDSNIHGKLFAQLIQ